MKSCAPPSPAVKVYCAGSVAAESVDVKATVPV